MIRRLVVTIIAGLIVASLTGLANAEPWTWDGKVRVGGIWLDQKGDESTMPETYNIYDGFMLSSMYFKGKSGQLEHLTVDLNDINQKNRRGVVDYRRTGKMHFRSNFTQSRWVFDPMAYVEGGRKSWDNKLSWTPKRTIRVSAGYNLQSRDANRIGLNPGYEGWLGTAYDTKLHRYRLEAQANSRNGIGGMVAFDGVKQTDGNDPSAERNGYVFSANLHVPGYKVKSLTHVVQASIGRSEVRESGLGFDMKTFQYTGVWQQWKWMRWRYRFYGSEVDDEATKVQTNNFYHDIDATFSYSVAVLTLGYGWEALDGDLTMSTTNKFRGTLALKDPKNKISGRVSFDGRNRDDEEKTALLRDSENRRWDARVDARPVSGLAFGVRGNNRERKYPDIDVKACGVAGTAYAAWNKSTKIKDIPVTVNEVGIEYTYADDDYNNLWGRQHIVSNAVTGRVGFTLHDDFDVMGSFTYLDLNEDLDLEKSLMSFGAAYRLQNGWSVDVKYNVYNYDDYVLLDRYYTANVVWFNVGYKFSAE